MSADEIVVVTGATSGVGRAVVRRFARPGVSLGLVARGRDGLEGARREVEAAGGRALTMACDIADPDALDAVAQAVEEAYGPIDIWINNAMTTVFGFFDDVEPDEFRRATDVTYHGTVWGTRAALARMLPRDRGTIVQIGSAMAYQGIPLQAPYCGAKHAIKGLHESVRCELRHRGSRVHLTMVQLPGLNTPQFEHARDKLANVPRPVPPVYQPEVAAEAVHWAAHHRRREVVVGVPSLYTIWGNRLAPWLVERYLARTAVGSQQADRRTSASRIDNLFEAPPGDPRAHGPYDDMAHARSVQLWATTHRSILLTAALAASAGAAGGSVARALREWARDRW